jgi:hypothetical protein
VKSEHKIEIAAAPQAIQIYGQLWKSCSFQRRKDQNRDRKHPKFPPISPASIAGKKYNKNKKNPYFWNKNPVI